MRQDFYLIYDLLYADYVYDSGINDRRLFRYRNNDIVEYDLIRILRASIDVAEDNVRNSNVPWKTVQLRPDAKYFLLVNFHNLILRPLLSALNREKLEKEQDLNELIEAIQADIEAIIEESSRRNENFESLSAFAKPGVVGGDAISGHQIMSAIDKIWKQLKTTRFEIWG